MNEKADVQWASRKYALEAFASNDPKRICRALVSIAFYDDDWQWVQDKCLHYLEDNDEYLACLAATCLGHIARIHGKLDREKVLPSLHAKASDPRISSCVSDALDDIDMFVA
ncbi:hypothetical protein [Solimonas fluminis]|uniref:hypothetical protein n=1 Tax=Solimonas fluminis TaxID=2086571 RepID=UPI001057567F|nr:hypothetical protein [Solimonas fluminis]